MGFDDALRIDESICFSILPCLISIRDVLKDKLIFRGGTEGVIRRSCIQRIASVRIAYHLSRSKRLMLYVFLLVSICNGD